MGKKIYIIGGGAAGFFAAIQHKTRFPENEVVILEKSVSVLQKVKISGGGRCNLTHACFDNRELSGFYPRGNKELPSVFSRFSVKNLIEWFENEGVKLCIEDDNRMFPASNSSQTVIDCFLKKIKDLDIKILHSCGLKNFETGEKIELQTDNAVYLADSVLFATGSNPKIWDLLREKSFEIVLPVPSLFTFNIEDSFLKGLEGIAVSNVIASVKGTKLVSQGALLITHWGLSAPAILKLSAFGARILHDFSYRFTLIINFLPLYSSESARFLLEEFQRNNIKKQVGTFALAGIPNRLWKKFVEKAGILPEMLWADVSKSKINRFADILTNCEFEVNGKSTFKDEFVTAGGVSLKEIDFRSMASKKQKNIFFAGEVLDIDALTGGFNFQAAWSTAWLAAQNM